MRQQRRNEIKTFAQVCTTCGCAGVERLKAFTVCSDLIHAVKAKWIICKFSWCLPSPGILSVGRWWVGRANSLEDEPIRVGVLNSRIRIDLIWASLEPMLYTEREGMGNIISLACVETETQSGQGWMTDNPTTTLKLLNALEPLSLGRKSTFSEFQQHSKR